MSRCRWVNLNNPLYVEYHDKEWSNPEKTEKELYELFVLETFQAGLSWECVLNKREAFRMAYDHFDAEVIARYDEAKIHSLMENRGIIRNRLKILASVSNTKIYLAVSREFGSFRNYILSFFPAFPVYESYTEKTTSDLSDAISADLKKRGMKFCGSTIIYSFLQAAGFISAHGPECILCRQRISQ